jgi:hypothetical protein
VTHRMSERLPRTDNLAYDLRQRLDRAMRWLREAEDIARIEMPAWPTADRIRSIYEQITADVLNGKTSVPPIRQRLTEAEAEVERLRELARAYAYNYGVDPGSSPELAELVGKRKLPEWLVTHGGDEPVTQRSITLQMVKAGGDALKGQIGQMGCLCPWDDDGNPIGDCKCADRMEQERWRLAERVLRAARDV